MRLNFSGLKEKGRIMEFLLFLALLVSPTFLFAENSRIRGIVEKPACNDKYYGGETKPSR